MSIISDVKDILSLPKIRADAEVYQILLDLISKILPIIDENEKLKRENTTLKERENTKSKMNFKSPFCYMEGDENPYCPRCWENDKKAIHLIQKSKSFYSCPQCPFSHGEREQIRFSR